MKDLGIVLEIGCDAKAVPPLAAITHRMFLAVSGRGDDAKTAVGSFAPTPR